MRKILLFAAILFFFILNSAECKTPLTQPENSYFYPVADTFVYEKSNTIPINSLELRVGNLNTIDSGNIRSALKFNLSEIPENSIIHTADA